MKQISPRHTVSGGAGAGTRASLQDRGSLLSAVRGDRGLSPLGVRVGSSPGLRLWTLLGCWPDLPCLPGPGPQGALHCMLPPGQGKDKLTDPPSGISASSQLCCGRLCARDAGERTSVGKTGDQGSSPILCCW